MRWNVKDIPDQTGRVAVITGATGGLGLACAHALAGRRAHVLMAARNTTKAERVRAQILTDVPDASLEIVRLDLGDLASVESAAATILEAHPWLDILINNAGVMATPETRTVDGFEQQVGINHLGHFALTARLLPALAAGVAARIVAVTSTGRHAGRVLDPEDPFREGRYAPWRAYGDSKLANLLFAVELDARLRAAGSRIASLVAHPGLSATDLQTSSVKATDGGASQRFFHGLARFTGMSPERAALSQLRAATDPRARGGEFYTPRFVNGGSPVRRPILPPSRSRERGQQLWAVSERQTGIAFDVEELIAGHE